MPEKKGIDNLKEVVNFGLKAAEMVKEAKDNNGKYDLGDLSLLLNLVPYVQPAFEGMGEIPGELKDMDQEEAAELVSHVASEWSVGDEQAKVYVVKGLRAAYYIYDLAREF